MTNDHRGARYYDYLIHDTDKCRKLGKQQNQT